MQILYRLISVLASPSVWLPLVMSGSRSVSSVETFLALRRRAIEISTFIDVGANHGQFALTAAHFYPASSIHSFEPVPEIAAELKASCRRKPQITVHPVALGDTDGEMPFYRNSYSQVSSALPIHDQNAHPDYDPSSQARITVAVQTLDRALESHRLEGPVMLKLDAQGYEHVVLAGARRVLSDVDFVLIEMPFMNLYDGQMDFSQLHDLLLTLDFAVVAPMGFHSSRIGISEVDMLYQRLSESGS